MAGEVGVAWVTLAPKADGFGRKMESAVGPQVDKSGKGIGSKLASGMGKTLKTGAVVAGGAVAGILGTSLVKGFGRLNAIDQAEAKLRGLGVTGKSLEGVMDNVTKSVTGTAFGLDEAAGAAAGALASGVKEGKELEGFLTLVGDAATQAGTDFNSMSQIMTKIQGNGKLTGDTLQQLTDNQLFALPMLAEAYKVPQDEMRKMVSEGKVSATDFQKVLKQNIGGAAQESGKTFSGALANMNAALGRLGASVLGGVFSQMPKLFGGATKALDGLGPVAERVGAAVGGAMTRAANAVRNIDWSPLINFGQTVKSDLLPAIVEFGMMVGQNLVAVFKTLGPPLLTVGGAITTMLVPALTFLLEKAVEFEGVLVPLVAAITAGVLAFKTYATTVALVTAAKTAWLAVQTALNAVLLANPVGLVIAAVAALSVGLVVAYKRSETFRNIVNAVFNAVKAAAQAFGAVVKKVFASVVAAVNKMRTGVASAFKAISGAFKSLVGSVSSAMSSVAGALAAAGAKVGQFAGVVRGGMAKVANAFKAGATNALNAVKALPGQILGVFKGAAAKMYSAGSELINRLVAGIAASGGKIVAAVKKAAGKFAKFLPGSPVKEGPLRVFNRGKAGRLLMQMLADGILTGSKQTQRALRQVFNSSVKQMKKALKATKKGLDKATKRLDLFKSIRDQVKSAFSPDLFSGSLAEFLRNMQDQLANNKAVQSAMKVLQSKGAKGNFLTSLMSSGNSELILALAGADAKALKQAQADWNAVQSSASAIGNQVAKADVGLSLAQLNNQVKKLNKTMTNLDKRIGKEVSKGINKGAKKGKRNGKR